MGGMKDGKCAAFHKFDVKEKLQKAYIMKKLKKRRRRKKKGGFFSTSTGVKRCNTFFTPQKLKRAGFKLDSLRPFKSPPLFICQTTKVTASSSSATIQFVQFEGARGMGQGGGFGGRRLLDFPEVSELPRS